MIRTEKSALFCAALFAMAPAWAVNKCKGPNGSVIFQQAACADSGITVAEDIEKRKAQQLDKKPAVATPTGTPTGAGALPPDIQKKLQAARQESDDVLATARASCTREVIEYPVIGMTEADFKNCTQFGLLVQPDKINETETAAGVSKQYVYRRDYSGIRFLYVRNGRVSAIQR